MNVILYLDTSALVKQYVFEAGSDEVASILGQAQLAGSSAIARVELEAALAKYVRMSALPEDAAKKAVSFFWMDWELLAQLIPDDAIIDLASALVWRHSLRGYDAIHLGTALKWQTAIRHPVVFATFDKKLWQAAADAGLTPFPDDLSPFLLR